MPRPPAAAAAPAPPSACGKQAGGEWRSGVVGGQLGRGACLVAVHGHQGAQRVAATLARKAQDSAPPPLCWAVQAPPSLQQGRRGARPAPLHPPRAEQQHRLAVARQAQRKVEEQGGLAAALRPAEEAVLEVGREGRRGEERAREVGPRGRRHKVGQRKGHPPPTSCCCCCCCCCYNLAKPSDACRPVRSMLPLSSRRCVRHVGRDGAAAEPNRVV